MKISGKVNFERAVLILAAVTLILAGVSHKGFKDVKNKAAHICYECIGIG